MKNKIINILTDICDTPNVNFESDELLYSGILGSLGLMTLIVELSEQFDIEIDVDDLEFENFSTLDNIVELVKKVKNGI